MVISRRMLHIVSGFLYIITTIIYLFVLSTGCAWLLSNLGILTVTDNMKNAFEPLVNLLTLLLGALTGIGGWWANRLAQEPDEEKLERRLDAAMPSETQLQSSTEVWVQVCLPASEGFRKGLPQFTSSGEEIGKQDVKGSVVPIVFPIDEKGRVQKIEVRIELTAEDFEFHKAREDIALFPDSDSAMVLFTLYPKRHKNNAFVHIHLKKLAINSEPSLLGAVSLGTKIHSGEVKNIPSPSWHYASTRMTTAIANSSNVSFTNIGDNHGQQAGINTGTMTQTNQTINNNVPNQVVQGTGARAINKLIDFGSAKMGNVSIGDVAAGDMTKVNDPTASGGAFRSFVRCSMNIQVNTAAAAAVDSKADLLKLIAQVQADLAALEGMPDDEREQAELLLRQAKKAGDGDNKTTLMQRLEAAQKILFNLDTNMPMAYKLGETIGVLIQRAMQIW